MNHASTKICQDCRQPLPLTAFTRSPRNKQGVLPKCKKCRQKHLNARWASDAHYRKSRSTASYACQKQQRKHDNRRILLASARQRAKRKQLPFNLTLDDIVIPERCPVFNTILAPSGKRSPIDSSPTIDRLCPEKGYVRGNIAVISHLANRIKSNATLAQLECVAAYIKNTTQPRKAASPGVSAGSNAPSALPWAQRAVESASSPSQPDHGQPFSC